MRYLVCFFTASGNTGRAVQLCTETLEARGHTVDLVSITKGLTVPDVSRYDRIVVAFPVLAFAPPVFVAKFIRRLPGGMRDDGTRVEAAVLAVDAGGGRGAASIAVKALARRGYDVVRSGRAGYTENWTQFFPVRGEAEIARANAAGDRLALAFTTGLINGDRELCSAHGAWWTRPLSPLFGLAGRKIMGKLYYADEDCDACGHCARTCPACAISIGPGPGARPYWSSSCEGCNRCINTCPKAAVVTSLGRALTIATLIVGIAWAGIWAYLWLISSGPLTNLPGALHTVVDIASVAALLGLAHAAAIGPFDRFVLRNLQRFHAMRRFFAWTFMKGRQYYNPGLDSAAHLGRK